MQTARLTGPRLRQWRLPGRMLLGTARVQTSDDMIDAIQTEDKWLEQFGPWIGNTVTEITRVAPNELSVVRNSPLGFTGIEMFALSEWLSSVASGAAGSPASPPGNPLVLPP